MNSPSKRRKTNNHRASDQPVRSLDFFFGKQKQKDTPRDAQREIGQDGVEKVTEANGVGEQPMTDEEYARKLQEEYAQEERKRNGSPVVNVFFFFVVIAAVDVQGLADILGRSVSGGVRVR